MIRPILVVYFTSDSWLKSSPSEAAFGINVTPSWGYGSPSHLGLPLEIVEMVAWLEEATCAADGFIRGVSCG